MSNLVISLLVVALTGILMVTGLPYIGTIYSESQANAQAAELVANAAKVATALRAWSQTNGSRATGDSSWSAGTSAALIGGSNQYLDSLPMLGSYAQGNGSSDYYFKAMPLSAVMWNNEGGTSTSGFDGLFAVITSTGVCNAVARLARGDSAVPTKAGTSISISSATPVDFSGYLANADFNCAYADANSNNTLDSGESMFFLYKVF